jgi:hypothetical protein
MRLVFTLSEMQSYRKHWTEEENRTWHVLRDVVQWCKNRNRLIGKLGHHPSDRIWCVIMSYYKAYKIKHYKLGDSELHKLLLPSTGGQMSEFTCLARQCSLWNLWKKGLSFAFAHYGGLPQSLCLVCTYISIFTWPSFWCVCVCAHLCVCVCVCV